MVNVVDRGLSNSRVPKRRMRMNRRRMIRKRSKSKTRMCDQVDTDNDDDNDVSDGEEELFVRAPQRSSKRNDDRCGMPRCGS
jgi:hypothetical protein